MSGSSSPAASPVADPPRPDEAVAAPHDLRRQRRRRRLGLAAALGALLVVVLLSLALGSKSIPLSAVLHALRSGGDDEAAVIVLDQRVPRTVLGIVVGAALAVAGALMQGLTRNPLADPGLLGVSAGASFAMAIGLTILPAASLLDLIWFSFAGAVATTVAVYIIGSARRTGASPVTLLLAGVAIGSVLSGITTTLTLLHPATFTRMRVWDVGALSDRGWDVIVTVLPFIAVGMLLAASAGRGLNAVALGDDLAVSLGGSIARTRVSVIVAVTLLCGAATAAVGPIWFLGMMVPHVARWIVGPDQRWILAYSVVIGSTLLVAADVVGRVVVRPAEMPAGVVTAFIGAPVLILLVRRRRASGL